MIFKHKNHLAVILMKAPYFENKMVQILKSKMISLLSNFFHLQVIEDVSFKKGFSLIRFIYAKSCKSSLTKAFEILIIN